MAQLQAAYEWKAIEFVKGNPITLAECKANKQAAVVEIFAKWCPPCRQAIPHVSALQKKYSDVVFIGITQESAQVAKEFSTQMGDEMQYRVASDSSNQVIAKYMKYANAQGIPHAFVINKHGQIYWHGHPMTNEFVDAIQYVRSEKVHDPIVVPKTASPSNPRCFLPRSLALSFSLTRCRLASTAAVVPSSATAAAGAPPCTRQGQRWV